MVSDEELRSNSFYTSIVTDLSLNKDNEVVSRYVPDKRKIPLSGQVKFQGNVDASKEVVILSPKNLNRIRELKDFTNDLEKSYYINERTSTIYFSDDLCGKTVWIDYYSKGMDCIGVNKIYTELDNNGNIIETMEDATLAQREINSYLSGLTQTGSIDSKINDLNISIENAEESIEDIITATTTANTCKSNLNTVINASRNAKTDLESSVQSSATTKNNLDISINNGSTLKSELDNTITSGNTTKDNLNSVITSGNTLKTNLNTSISTGSTLKTNLDTANSTASTNIDDLDTKNATAVTNCGNLDTKNTLAGTNITNLEAKNTTASTNIGYLDSKNATAQQRINDLDTAIATSDLSKIKNVTDSAFKSALQSFMYPIGIHIESTSNDADAVKNSRGGLLWTNVGNRLVGTTTLYTWRRDK